MSYSNNEKDILDLCSIQADIFESCVEEKKNELDFISKYMKSIYARSLDNDEYWISSFDKYNIINEISRISKNKPRNNFKASVLRFIGYFYRYYCYLYKTQSICAWKNISFDYLYENYDVLHSLDIKKACTVANNAMLVSRDTK